MAVTSSEISENIAEVLRLKGVKRVVLSPGSRNAPLIAAFAKNEFFETFVVIDERAAAFMALGMAQNLRQPVALVCTSGSAVLNYAPAVAEAYYQGTPLIVISADRQNEWIDQDDSQTIRQAGALASVVKRSYDISDTSSLWYVNRVTNDALIVAESSFPGPVHINVQLAEPLYCNRDVSKYGIRKVDFVSAERRIEKTAMKSLAAEFCKAERVLIVAGFALPDATMSESIGKLAQMPNVAVLTETISNIGVDNVIKSIDRTLVMASEDEIKPDLLITCGGALVSRFLKRMLRNSKAAVHWHVGLVDNTIDTMQSLTVRVEAEPAAFFAGLAEEVSNHKSSGTYNQLWHSLQNAGLHRHEEYVGNIPWSDMLAFRFLLKNLPDNNCQLYLSNGTPVRYAQLFAEHLKIPCFCNRGVAGIDGCTSTALGASLAFSGMTFFITGDMGFVYDLGGLASKYKNPRLKIIIIRNGGGGIFRFISGDSAKPILKDYFEVDYDYRIVELVKAFGYKLYEAQCENDLSNSFATFVDDVEPSIMVIDTPRDENGDILRNYFKIK